MHCLDQRETLEYHSNVVPPKDMELVFALQPAFDYYHYVNLRQYVVMLMTGQLFLRNTEGDYSSAHCVHVNYHKTSAGQNYGNFFYYEEFPNQDPIRQQIFCRISNPDDPTDYVVLEMFDCSQLKEHPYKLAYPRGVRIPNTPFRIDRYRGDEPALENFPIKYPESRACSLPFNTVVGLDHRHNPVFASAVIVEGAYMQFVVDLDSVLDFLNEKPVHIIQAAATMRPVPPDTEL